MNRTDPFFAQRVPQRNNYLESLHRTYGEPPSALPTRNNKTYARALEFRRQEKERYKALEERNQILERCYFEMKGETDNIRTLFEQLSKAPANERAVDSDAAPTESIRTGTIDAHDGSGGVDVDSKAGDPGGGGADPSRVDEAPTGEAGVGGQVSGEVLRTDSRGHAAQHASEGPEQRDGAVVCAETDGD